MRWLWLILAYLKALLRDRAELATENLALRQQVSVYTTRKKRPKLNWQDKAFWVLLSKVWSIWRSGLAIVQPETVIGWHRKLFKVYWTWKSKRKKKPG